MIEIAMHPLSDLPAAYSRGQHTGITSVCSAHPVVIEAAIHLAKETRQQVLIEATCNQVNQDGGYTGMAPMDFRRFVEKIANRQGLPFEQIILGGDHLGPNPWKDLPAQMAMDKSEAMIIEYTKAGFTKLHLDTSMGCKDEPAALDDALTAQRAARLAGAAEAHKGSGEPVYVIGTEVPVPGGATHALNELELTEPDAVVRTYEVHKAAFEELGLQDAFSRVIGLVVQPGVEFGHTDVIGFDEAKARALSASLSALPGIVFEAHSTDYQSPEALRALVSKGFCILKVGPWLTFALREALYALDAIADVLDGHPPKGRLMQAMEDTMLAHPQNWQNYYSGSDQECWMQRHFSLSDRIRYYWPTDDAQKALDRLFSRLDGASIPGPLLNQYLGWQPKDLAAANYPELLLGSVLRVLDRYEQAIRP